MDISSDNKEKLNRYLHFLEQDPGNLNLLISISDSYRQLGDLDSAQLYLDKAKEIDSQACFAQQGIIDLNLGHFDEAKEALKKALLREDLPILRYGLAVCHYSLYESAEGIEILSPLLIPGSSSYDIEFIMAKLLHQANRFDEAIKSLETTLENHGSTGESLALLAQLYFDIEETELAENAAKQALLISPNNFEAQVIILLIRLTDGDTTVEEIEALLEQESEDPRLWFALGTTQLRALNLQTAEEAFQKAAELGPLFYDNWVSLGWSQLFLGKLKDAHNSYQQAVTVYEESPEAWGGLALVAALDSNLTEAERLIKKAKAIDSECFLAGIAQIIYFSNTNPDEGAKQFKQSFPTIADQLNAAIAIVLAEIDNPGTVVH
jgi:tetratricopeptide (TPR) repeat protein